MAKTEYRGSSHETQFTLGYYVFQLPNGETLDMFDPTPRVLTEDDLSKLKRRYVERSVTGHEVSTVLMAANPQRFETTDALAASLAGSQIETPDFHDLAECPHLVTDNFGHCENCYESV